MWGTLGLKVESNTNDLEGEMRVRGLLSVLSCIVIYNVLSALASNDNNLSLGYSGKLKLQQRIDGHLSYPDLTFC